LTICHEFSVQGITVPCAKHSASCSFNLIYLGIIMTTRIKPAIETTAFVSSAPTVDVADVAVKAETTHTAAPADSDESSFSYMEFMRSMASQVGLEIPSGKQMLAGSVMSIIVGLTGGYGVATIAGYVFLGAIVLSGSMFLAYLAMILAMIVGVYVVSIAAARAGAYVASGKLETDVVRAKSWVTALFTSAKPKAKIIAAVQS
jgi:hypothetical protein